ncbi:hypothetical protein H0H93_002387 [Arthromyces matolae]|nr:hypothetical protein H0H93_002387 [Arthromyces matolae]
MRCFSLFLVVVPFVYAARLPLVHDTINDHSHAVQKNLPTSWHQPDDHPVHALFKRGTPTDGANYAQVGTPAWSAPYPSWSPDVNSLPQEWVDALNAAVAAGNIPNIPQSSNTPGVNPVYPQGVNPNGPTVCSATYKCQIPGDIWDGPSDYFAISFDDGPTERATHFVIGVQILAYPQNFLEIFNAGHDLAVHTWTHPYMTTLSNLEIVAQLGWTAELIRNSTGGRVPRYWRPPYGDSDMRVRSIAKEVMFHSRLLHALGCNNLGCVKVFGLETVLWNHDTEDWSLTTAGGTTPQAVHNNFVQWLSGPKTTGIIVLEHEITNESVNAFMDGYPLIAAAGWKTSSLAQLIGNGTYQNSNDSESPVNADGIIPDDTASTSQSSSSSPAVAGQTTSNNSTPTATSASASPSKSSGAGDSVKTSNAASLLIRCDRQRTLIVTISLPALIFGLSFWL